VDLGGYLKVVLQNDVLMGTRIERVRRGCTDFLKNIESKITDK